MRLSSPSGKKASIAWCRNGKIIVLLLATFGVGRARTAHLAYEDSGEATSISESGEADRPDEKPAWRFVDFVPRAPGPLVRKVDKRLREFSSSRISVRQRCDLDVPNGEIERKIYTRRGTGSKSDRTMKADHLFVT